MPDYHQKFKERFPAGNLSGLISTTPENILSFIDEVVAEERQAAYVDGARDEKRYSIAALIAHVESLREKHHNGQDLYSDLLALLSFLREPDACSVHGKLGHDPQDTCCCGKEREPDASQGCCDGCYCTQGCHNPDCVCHSQGDNGTK